MFIPPGYANITWRGVNTFSGQIFNTSIGATVEDFGHDDLEVTEGAFWAEDSFGSYMWEGWVSLGVQVKIGTSDPSEPITLEGAAGAVGAGTGDPSAPNLSVLIKKLTHRGGRRGRGRMYIPGPQEAWVDGAGQLSTDAITAYEGATEEFVGNLLAIGKFPTLVLLHSEEADGLPNEISSFHVEAAAATQRRRMR